MNGGAGVQSLAGLLHGSNISDAFQEILNLLNRSQSDEYLKMKETTGPNLNLVNAMAGPSCHAGANNCQTQNMIERVLRLRKAVTRPETRMTRAAAL